ncbi:PIG-L family deacetylase [Oscillochloris sp. ZM17-4]|uniref:PIG-L deacetylase family protein n=1 Tax=Oscillochloris sp. ZM17-4 TaxID=2866714 RepID=UPI001C72EB1F|nr:PIG-L family deacetylase [Oscillochloris sp. ZM17-4]MBX0328019.1 PIG-L family deacetylase [Oscillochloris sp. ZM17-4]
MLFNRIAEIAAGYDHVYLSPHLDDAALCCGGMIAGQRVAGRRVLVVNICTGAPRPDVTFSELARAFHREWGLDPGEVLAARLHEDAAALEILGVDSLHVGVLDAIYRHPSAYDRRETLFGLPDEGDPLLPALRELISQLYERLHSAIFYAPLGVGGHVDHQITCRAALERIGPGLALYEDFPYVTREGELERRIDALGLPLRPQAIPIVATLPQKIAAVSAYVSQMAELAHSQLGRTVDEAAAIEVMAEAVTRYAWRVGGERVWLR